MNILTSSLLAILAATLATSASLSGYEYAVKKSQPVPRKWSRIGSAPGDTIMKVDISLKQS